MPDINVYSVAEVVDCSWGVYHATVAQWKMNDNAGNTTVLDSIGGYDGVSTRDTNLMTTTGKINSALNFNGTSDYVNCGNILKFGTGDFSIFAWVKLVVSPTQTNSVIISKGTTNTNGGFVFYTSADKKLYVVLDAGGWKEGTTALNDNVWHHAGITFENATGKLNIYVDGEADRAESIISSVDINADPMDVLIGARNPAGVVQFWDGDIDNVVVVDRVLTTDEIQQLYNDGNGTEALLGFEPDLLIDINVNDTLSVIDGGWDLTTDCVSLWKLNDNTTNATVVDSRGYSNGIAQQNTNIISVAGKINTALSFNGSTDYIDANAHFQSTFRDSFTIAFWVKLDDGHPSAVQHFCSTGDPVGADSFMWIFLRETGQIEFRYDSEGEGVLPKYFNAFSDGAQGWHHLAFTVKQGDGGTGVAYIYLDGVEVASYTNNTGLFDMSVFSNSTYNLYIGGRNTYDVMDSPMAGDLDCVAIYSRALLAGEIRELYNNGSGTEDLSETELPIDIPIDVSIYENIVIDEPYFNVIPKIVSQWKMNDDAANTDLDDSRNNYEGTLQRNSSLMSVPGKINTALDFNGTSDYASVGNIPVTSAYAITFWMKANDTAGSQRGIVFKDDNSTERSWGVSIKGGGGLRFQHFKGGGSFRNIDTTELYDDGQWHFVVCMNDNSHLYIYVDGVEVRKGIADGGNTDASNADVLIGRMIGQGYFTGVLDNVQYYNQALTHGEIKSLYQSGNGTEWLDSGQPTVLDVLNFSVLEDLQGLVTEHVDVLDLVVEVGVTPELFNVTESNEVSLGVLNIAVNDSIQTNDCSWGGQLSCVAQWKMNDQAGTTTVLDSVGSYDGTAQRNTNELTITGKIDRALNNNGSTDYIDASSTFQSVMRDSFSISIWLKPHDGQPVSPHCFMGSLESGGSSDVIQGIIHTDGSIYFQYKVDGASCMPSTSAGYLGNGEQGWTHIVVTFESGGGATGAKLYVNGKLEETADVGSITFANFVLTGNLFIGARGGSGSPTLHYDGLIDCTAIYDNVLSAGDVIGLYNGTIGTEDLSGFQPVLDVLYVNVNDVLSVVENLSIEIPSIDEAFSAYENVTVMSDNWDIASACISQWRMNDDASNTTVTDSVGTYNGTTQQNTENISVAGKINTALSFNGSTDYVDTNNTFSSIFQGSFSISLWVKPDDGNPANNQIIIGVLDSTGDDSLVYITLSTTGFISFQYMSEGNRGNNANTGNIFSDGQQNWHHICVIADSVIGGVGGKKIYIDGVEQVLINGDGSTSGVTFGDYTCGFNLFIGGRSIDGSVDSHYSGLIDCVAIYNRVLTTGEINGLYNAGIGTEYLDGNFLRQISTDISVAQTLSIIENISVYLTELNIDIAEDILYITDIAQITDLVIELGIVADAISVTEYVSLLDIIIELEIAETILITEYVLLLDITIELGIVYDGVSVQEIIAMDLLAVPEANVAIFEDVSITEDVQTESQIDIIIYEEVSITETISIYLNVLYVDRYDEVLITEVAQILDIVIELGVVADTVSIIENTERYIDELYLSEFEDTGIAENVGLYLDSLYLSVSDELVIEEYVELLDIVIGIPERVDDISIIENVTVNLDVLNIAISEDVLIEETVQMFDIVVELGVVADTVTIQEYTERYIDELYLSEYDSIGGIENVEIYIEVLNLLVSEDISIVEDVEINLDVLNIDIFDNVLITEVAQILDIMVEVGIVEDTLSTIEDIVADLDVLNIDIYDEVGIVESTQVFDIIVELEASEEISITEFIQILDIIVELETYDEAGTTEQVQVELDVLNIDTFDNVTITEDVQLLDIVVELGIVYDDTAVTEQVTMFIDVLNFAVNDNVLITESADIFDIIIELGVVQDTVSIAEDIVSVIGELYIGVSEDLNIIENITIQDIVIELEIYNAVNVSEDVAIQVEAVPDNNINGIEDITVNENAETEAQIFIDVFDEKSATEYIGIYVGVLYVDRYEDLLVTEVAQILDIVIEVGVVEDSVAVQENISIVLDRLNLGVEDSLTTEDIPQLYLDTIFTLITDEVSISEYAEVLDITVEIPLIYDTITVTEQVVQQITFLYILVYENIVTAEYANIFDIIIELGVVYDDVSVAEYLTMHDIIIELSAYDEVTVTESISMHDIVIELSAYDEVTVTEVVVTQDIIIELGVVADTVSITEGLTLNLSSLNLSVYEDIGVAEDATLFDIIVEMPLVVDDVSVTEDFEILISELNVSVGEDLLITEVAGIHDIIIELGVVAETSTATESVDVDINTLFVLVFEEINVVMDVEVLDTIIELSAEDTASITEYVSLLDIIIECGVVYDEVTVQEDISVSLDILIVDGSDNILLTESISVIDLIVEVGVVEDTAVVQESIQAVLSELFINVSDTAGVTEYIETVLDVLNVDEAETLTVTEFATAHDIVIELGVIFETTTATEQITLLLPELNLAVNDTLVVSETVYMHDIVIELFADDSVGVVENLDILLPELNINPSEDVSITETVYMHDIVVELFADEAVSVSEAVNVFLDTLFIEANDNVAVSETVYMYDIIIELYVEDEVAITEWASVLDIVIEIGLIYDEVTVTDTLVNLYLDVLNFNVVQPMMIVITEVASIIDLVVEVGVVSEYTTIAEYIESYLNVLNESAYSDVALQEFIDIVLPELLASESDNISVTEYVSMHDIVVEMSAEDDVAVSEYNFMSISSLSVGVDDNISVIEAVTMHDIVIELGVSENVAVTEYANVLDIVIELGIVYDAVVVVESVIVHDIIIELFASDVVSISESSENDMPLNFEAVEQRGVAIVTVGGW